MNNTKQLYNYTSLCETIAGLDKWQATSICAICADKVAPIVRRVGLPETWKLYQICLEEVWASLNQLTNKQKGQDLLNLLKAAPEWGRDDLSQGGDDFLHLPFIVGRALDFVNFALLATITPSSAVEQAVKALSLMLELTESFDTAASEFPNKVKVKALAIHLLESEQESQQRLVASLKRATSASSDQIDKMKTDARVVSEFIEKLLPIYCFYFLQS